MVRGRCADVKTLAGVHGWEASRRRACALLVRAASPVGSDGLLPANIPHVQPQAIVHQLLDVESLRLDNGRPSRMAQCAGSGAGKHGVVRASDPGGLLGSLIALHGRQTDLGRRDGGHVLLRQLLQYGGFAAVVQS